MVKKKDFIDRLSEKGYTKRDAEIITKDVIETIEDILIGGESVMFHGFGTFGTRQRPGYEMINPKTGEMVEAPPCIAAYFSPGKTLKRAINEGFIRR